MDLRVLTWNVFHGRGVPGAGRDLYAEFAAALTGWEWDIGLLQEVPRWWPDRLRQDLGCEAHTVSTSRNALLPIRRALAACAPDLIRSGGGGANAVLARSDRIVGACAATLCRWPERRRVHGVALACGVWISNLQASAGPSPAAGRDLREAVRISSAWAGARRLPLILGGDLNLRTIPETDRPGLRIAASSGVDHVLHGEGVEPRPGTVACLEHGPLSDHAPLAVTLAI